jgi:hypothetical protein
MRTVTYKPHFYRCAGKWACVRLRPSWLPFLGGKIFIGFGQTPQQAQLNMHKKWFVGQDAEWNEWQAT